MLVCACNNSPGWFNKQTKPKNKTKNSGSNKKFDPKNVCSGKRAMCCDHKIKPQALQ